ncbi:MAG: hypothetical protein LBV58_01750 [Acholeplasmatales bacterium]|jgi:TPR repeat protein|nr:hypothetical protein [Acholeplasmatales bacterium]
MKQYYYDNIIKLPNYLTEYIENNRAFINEYEELIDYISSRTDKESVFVKAFTILLGIRRTANKEEGFKLIESLESLNNPKVFNVLGYCYYLGYGTEKNVELAIKYYKLSSDLGDLVGKSNYLALV